MAGGSKRQHVRCDGEAAVVSQVRLSVLATVAGGPYELIQEQTSIFLSTGNGLTDGAVKEARTKIGTLRCELEKG